MSSTFFSDESSFIRNSNIFEWTPGEKRVQQQKIKVGYAAVLDILDELGYFGYNFYQVITD